MVCATICTTVLSSRLEPANDQPQIFFELQILRSYLSHHDPQSLDFRFVARLRVVLAGFALSVPLSAPPSSRFEPPPIAEGEGALL